MGEVLLIGEERERSRGIRALLRQDGHHVSWSREIESWRDLERETLPEVVVAPTAATDTILEASGRVPHGFPAPLLFVHHEAEVTGRLHLDERLVDRLTSPFEATELLARVDALLRLRRVVQRSPAQGARSANGIRGFLTRLGTALGRRVPGFDRPRGQYVEVAARVAGWADERDAFEPGHAERVTSAAAMIADVLSLPDHEAGVLLRAAMLHDIGKVGLPVEVLRQLGPLEEDQMRMMRTHPERGATLLQALDPDPEVAETIRLHHERLDGEGYYRKTPAEVPRNARILAVAEAYDAMITSQVREPLSSDRALGLLYDLRGAAYDAECVEALIDVMRPRPKRIPVSTGQTFATESWL